MEDQRNEEGPEVGAGDNSGAIDGGENPQDVSSGSRASKKETQERKVKNKKKEKVDQLSQIAASLSSGDTAFSSLPLGDCAAGYPLEKLPSPKEKPVEYKPGSFPDGKLEEIQTEGTQQQKVKEEEEEPPPEAAVFDNGTYSTKVGLSPDKKPKAVFPSVVGTYKDKSKGTEVLVGEDAEAVYKELDLNFPILYGIMWDWGGVEKIWAHSFYNILKKDPEQLPVLITENPLNPKDNRERIAQIMFDKFNVPQLLIVIQPTLALFGTNRCTGTTIDLGAGVTDVVPIFHGYAIPHAIARFEIGGNELTHYLVEMLEARGLQLTEEDKVSINDLKEQLVHVPDNYEVELANKARVQENPDKAKFWTLPSNGEKIDVYDECLKIGEALMQPSLVDSKMPALYAAVVDAIVMCEQDLRRDLFTNIVMVGGGSEMKGISERLRREMNAMVPRKMLVRVLCLEDRANSACIGGVTVANLSKYREYWLTREQYAKEGATAILEKCI